MRSNRLIYGAWVVVLSVGAFAASMRGAFDAHPPGQISEIDAPQEDDPRVPDTAHVPGTLNPPAEAIRVGPTTDPEALIPSVFEEPPQQPGQLPIVSQADPLSASKLAALRQIIREELPGAGADEIEIWADQYQDLPEDTVRFLLQQKRATDEEVGRATLSDFGTVDLPPAAVGTFLVGSANAETLNVLEAARRVCVNNLLNTQTPGFKRGTLSLSGRWDAQPGLATGPAQLDMQSGPMLETGRALDLAIEGDGFFVVRSEDTVYYTRLGRCVMNAERRLVIHVAGRELEFEGLSPIPDAAHAVKVTADGHVQAVTSDDVATDVGRLQLARFLDPSSLNSHGGCVFLPSSSSGPACPLESATIRQFRLEGSNASPETERRQLDELETWASQVLQVP